MKKSLKVRNAMITIGFISPILFTPILAISCENTQIKKDAQKVVINNLKKATTKPSELDKNLAQEWLNDEKQNEVAKKYNFEVLEVINVNDKEGKLTLKIRMTEKLSDKDLKSGKKPAILELKKDFVGFKKMPNSTNENLTIEQELNNELQKVKVNRTEKKLKKIRATALESNFNEYFNFSNFDQTKFELLYKVNQITQQNKEDGTATFEYWLKSLNSSIESEHKTYSVEGLKTLSEEAQNEAGLLTITIKNKETIAVKQIQDEPLKYIIFSEFKTKNHLFKIGKVKTLDSKPNNGEISISVEIQNVKSEIVYLEKNFKIEGLKKVSE
ncbi:hypothetical protein DMC14_000815 [Metamycoplasma phocicerebrale]|uniref:Lipoprotein-associated type-17 domain-containing protein n=1 Tax=Metamycoplasma phocicerebrale TaxID=142649 RepID=A0A3T0TTG2_9BACT|nr:lipoprotein 17-related variable surface protein [Metamycoplasma phocicerebrale]AZZ65334.1 hypothetical protein DMC14_000815 [Metamycoplasma phocicerebrale]